MEAVNHLVTLRADTDRLASAAEVDLRATVPSCPEWTMTDLVVHVGRIHRWVEGIVRTRATGRPGFPPRPEPDTDLPAWLREGGDRLVETLTGMGDDPVWNFVADRPVAGFWPRRQAQETAVHRWDAQRAIGQQEPIDADLAADGIDELLTVLLRARGPGAAIAGHVIGIGCSDRDARWVVSFDPDGGRPPALPGNEVRADADVAGPASDLLLFLWNRVPADTVKVTGDPAVAALWAATIRL